MDTSHVIPHRSWKVRAATVPTVVSVIGFVVLVVAFVNVFVPPLQTRFVSDTFVQFDNAKAMSFHDVLSRYIPSAATWYRPTTTAVFWFEVRIFGSNPVGYHVFALACHMLTAGLIYELARRLTGVRWAALLAALIFLFCPQAHEPLWDVADLHTVLSGPVLLAALLAYDRRRVGLALILTALALTVDEAGVLVIALIAAYECLTVKHAWQRAELARVAIRLAPFLALGIVYAVARMLPGNIYSEVANPCPDQSCVLAAIPQYLNRLFLRPDEFLALTRRVPWVFALLCLILGCLLLWLRPWDWSTWRPALFGVAWVVVGSLMFILTLWPYFDDRFMYVADMGFAILVGSVAAEVKRLWHGSTKDQRARLVAVATVFLFWFGSGIPMLVVRGQDWIAAGLQAEAIVDGVHRLLPDPPSGSVLVFTSVPGMASPGITPGEIGPYVFHNGLAAALRLSYGHGGFSVLIGEPPADEGGPVIVFDVKGSKVTLLSPPVTLTVSGLTSPRLQASTGSIRVTVVDADGNRTKWYRGTVHFTSSDPAAKLPDDYTFTAADAGTHVFSVTLEAAGSQTISATDKATPGVSGFQTVSVT